MLKRKVKKVKKVKKKKSKKKVHQVHGKNKEQSPSKPKHECARDTKGRILPGNTANPGGRPVGRYSLTTILENILRKHKGKAKQTQGEVLMKDLLKYAKKGDSRLFSIIMERIDGKVPEHLITTDTGPLSELDDEALDRIIRAGRPNTDDD